MFNRWNYRVRDCKLRMVGYYDTLQEVVDLFEPSPFLINLLEQGISVSDGKRYKIDIRGRYHNEGFDLP